MKINKNIVPGSLRSMATEILSQISGGAISIDADISVRQIEREVIDTANRIQKEYDEQNERKGIKISDSRYRTFSCQKIQDTTDFSCGCGPSWSLKKVNIGSFLSRKGSALIKFVGVLDDEAPLKFIKVSSIGEAKRITETINKPLYITLEESLYLILPQKYRMMETVTVIGVPDDVNAKVTEYDPDPWCAVLNVDKEVKDRIKDSVVRSIGHNFLSTKQFVDKVANKDDAQR